MDGSKKVKSTVGPVAPLKIPVMRRNVVPLRGSGQAPTEERKRSYEVVVVIRRDGIARQFLVDGAVGEFGGWLGQR